MKKYWSQKRKTIHLKNVATYELGLYPQRIVVVNSLKTHTSSSSTLCLSMSCASVSLPSFSKISSNSLLGPALLNRLRAEDERDAGLEPGLEDGGRLFDS